MWFSSEFENAVESLFLNLSQAGNTKAVMTCQMFVTGLEKPLNCCYEGMRRVSWRSQYCCSAVACAVALSSILGFSMDHVKQNTDWVRIGVRSLHGLCFPQPGAPFKFRWWKTQGFLDLRREVRMCRCYACKMFWFPEEANVPMCQGGIPRNRTVLVRWSWTTCPPLMGFMDGFQEVSRRCWVPGSAMTTCAIAAGAGFRQQNYYQRLG